MFDRWLLLVYWERYGEMVDIVHSHNHLEPRVINPDGGVRKVLLEQVNTC